MFTLLLRFVVAIENFAIGDREGISRNANFASFF